MLAAAGLSPEAQRLLSIRGDFRKYAASALKILDKEGRYTPLMLNRAQEYAHEIIEKQLRETGRVRAIALKGRQQGFSTYVEGRFYWKLTGDFGKRAFILTHMDDATTNLFNMTKRYNEQCHPAVRPHVKFDNAKELFFDVLDSRYSVATAGSKGAGRSATAQYFHGSEVAFWPNAASHMAGLGQVVPDAPGTEVILESTANGVGNMFHKLWNNAQRGLSGYIPIFIPWFWQREYRKLVPPGTQFDPDEREYATIFGLDDEQLYWRRMKIIDDFSDDSTLFDQEYPANDVMAFMAGTKGALITPLVVAKACIEKVIDEANPPIVMGVDVAEYGDDDSVITTRRGRRILKETRRNGLGNSEVAGLAAHEYELLKRANLEPDAICVDVTGVGTGVESHLTGAGFTNVYRIHNGATHTVIQREKYNRKGDECWGEMSEWFKNEPVDASALSDTTRHELSSRKYSYDASRRLVMESKEKMKREGRESPDGADALSLTFAVSVQPRNRAKVETLAEKLRRLHAQTAGGGGGAMGA